MARGLGFEFFLFCTQLGFDVKLSFFPHKINTDFHDFPANSRGDCKNRNPRAGFCSKSAATGKLREVCARLVQRRATEKKSTHRPPPRYFKIRAEPTDTKISLSHPGKNSSCEIFLLFPTEIFTFPADFLQIPTQRHLQNSQKRPPPGTACKTAGNAPTREDRRRNRRKKKTPKGKAPGPRTETSSATTTTRENRVRSFRSDCFVGSAPGS